LSIPGWNILPPPALLRLLTQAARTVKLFFVYVQKNCGVFELFNLKGKVGLVAGATRGIGKGTAL
jgi:hypothetical protein